LAFKIIIIFISRRLQIILPAQELLNRLHTTPAELTRAEARRRRALYGPNLLQSKRKTDSLTLLLAQFKSPIIIILLGAAILSYFTAGKADAIIIGFIVVISSLLGFWQEGGAANALAKLLSVVQIKAAVWRNGQQTEIPVERIVPGDIVNLAAGDSIPGDCLILLLYILSAELLKRFFYWKINY
jgi:P-type Mg2+ transporter